MNALRSTRNSSAPGPDGLSYRLIKLTQCTPLGWALLNDIILTTENPNYDTPQEWRQMRMCMIPKAGKDHLRVKGW